MDEVIFVPQRRLLLDVTNNKSRHKFFFG